jgi:polyribonucleotide nucleotidyltransferase
MVNGASAALVLSDIPSAGPIGCVGMKEVNGKLVTNPPNEIMIHFRLDLVSVADEKEMNDDQSSTICISTNSILIKTQENLVRQYGKPKQALLVAHDNLYDSENLCKC